jgi:rubredoxin
MMLEHMVCSDCGAVFDEELFAEDPAETFVCPLCGTVALDAEPMEDRVLHIHCRIPAAAAARIVEAEAPRLSA